MLQPSQSKAALSVPWWAVVLLSVLAAGGAAGAAIGPWQVWFLALGTWISEAALAVLVGVSAGGYGGLVVGRLAPASAPRGLRAMTACGLGLWMLSTAVLAVGAAGGGLLTPAVWWPVIAVGVLLAIWQGRRAVRQWRWPGEAPASAAIWVFVAAAIGLSIAGAMRPPGFIGTASGDAYDVLEYHLAVPREFFHAGRIVPLWHNVYSFYPLGVEMLYLLMMALRNSPLEAIYSAKLLHALFAAVAVAAVAWSLRREQPARGRTAALLLAAAPGAIYLSWLAMSELAEVCYAALALLWLRLWLQRPSWRAAGIVGLLLGCACAVKYLSVGLIAGPVLAVMLVCSLRSAPRLGQVALAGAVSLLPLGPWLVRNAIHTGDPVFPLATTIFGRGHWTEQCQRRWIDGHSPDNRPPVPEPPGWQRPAAPRRGDTFLRQFAFSPWAGPLTLALALAGVVAALARRRGEDRWDLALAGVWAGQVAVWAAFTRGMPWRFLAPALAPAALLAGGALARLAGWGAARPRRASSVPVGKVAALALLLAAPTVNLLIARGLFLTDTGGRSLPPLSGRDVADLAPPYARCKLPPGGRLMLVGEATSFYWPAGTIYATVFDTHPLERMIDQGLSPREILGELRRMGVTHVRVNWSEIWRLSNTYGLPSALSFELYQRRHEGRPPGLELFDRLVDLGAKVVVQPTEQDRATVYELPR